MTIQIEKSKKAIGMEEQKIFVYGRPKIGKTTFANQFPKPLFLATEAGHSQLDCDKMNIHNWENFLEACKYLSENQGEYETIIIDIVDYLYDFCSDYICVKKGFDHPSDLPMGKGYGFINEEFRRVVNKLTKLGFTLVLISHQNIEKIETKTKKYDMFTPTITGKTRKFILGLCDHVLFITSIMENEKEVRIIRTSGSIFWDAGSRKKELEEAEEIPFSFEALKKYFK